MTRQYRSGTARGGSQLVAGDGGRLACGHVSLHAGDPLEVLVAGKWVPGRVERDDRLGWYALLPQEPGDGGTLWVRLRIGMWVRLGGWRGR